VAEPWEDIDAAYQSIGRDLFGRDDLRDALHERSPDEAAFFTLVLVGGEIDNGGFPQLFTNSTGDLIDLAIAGAEHFDLHEHARLLRDASEQLFPAGVPLDWQTRWQQWEAATETEAVTDEAIEALDNRWYALNEVLENRLHAYVTGQPLP
jgi:hypothetical protein